MKLGDVIASVAQPIAGAVDSVFGTQIKGCSGCKQMQNNLNAGMSFADAIYDRFWHKNGKEEHMQYIITTQKSVEANTPEEAMSKIAEATTVAISVTARPQPMQAQPK